jgi:hypothetical protein
MGRATSIIAKLRAKSYVGGIKVRKAIARSQATGHLVSRRTRASAAVPGNRPTTNAPRFRL